MPTVEITVGEWAQGRASEIAHGARRALAAALDVDEIDQDVSVITLPTSHFLAPGDRRNTFARVKVHMWAGKALADKQCLYHAMLEQLRPYGVERIKLIIFDMPPENATDRSPPRQHSMDAW